MELPQSIRESLVNDLEEFLSNLPDDPDAEMVSNFILEQLEIYAEDHGIEDIVVGLEESGSLDGALRDELESEMSSNDDFEFTEEECIDLLETMCDIEWVEDEDELEPEEEEEEEDEDEADASEDE
ncbi:MAG: hypothetical protein H6732_16775 [Alphaproteobacteria bacterium]|nr:hypothetical protein [Alphaproteobacteria bacterium]